MSVGAGLDLIAEAVVGIGADTSQLDTVLDAIPSKIEAKLSQARFAIGAQMGGVLGQLDAAKAAGDAAEVSRLTGEYARLRTQMAQATGELMRYRAAMELTNLSVGKTAGQSKLVAAAAAEAAAATGKITPAADGASASVAGVARAMLLLTRAGETGMGLRAVSGIMAWAPALGLVALALGEVIKHWSDLTSIFDSTEGLERAKNTLEGLHKTVKGLQEALASGQSLSMPQIDELEVGKIKIRAQEAEESGFKAISGPTDVQAERAKKAQEIFKESGRDPDQLAEEMLQSSEQKRGAEFFLNEKERKRVSQMRRDVTMTPENQEYLDGIIAGARQRALDEMKAQLGRAAGGLDQGALERAKELSPSLRGAALKRGVIDREKEVARQQKEDEEEHKEELERQQKANQRQADADSHRKQAESALKSEAGHYAGQLEKSRKFARGEITEDDILGAIEANPEVGAGRADPALARAVAEKLKKDLEDRITEQVLHTGQSREAAAEGIRQAAEAKEKLEKDQLKLQIAQGEAHARALNKQIQGSVAPHFESLDTFMNSLISIGDRSDEAKEQKEIAKDQLVVQQDMLAELKLRQRATYGP